MNEELGGREIGASSTKEEQEVGGSGHVPALAVRRISKSFDHTRALDDVDLTIHRGEVVALVGQNGSGKSTLVKILSGYHEPEPGGELAIDGVEVPLPLPPGQARKIGLSFVYQDLGLSPAMTVLENLNLSSRVRRGVKAWLPIWWRREHREAAAVLRRYGVSLGLDVRTGDLPPVDQARLAIVRSAHDLRGFHASAGDRSSILVLDEPTVFLPEQDLRFLFDLIRTIVGMGGSVLFISHDLVAVREIADRIVVLRDGHKVAEVQRGEIDEDELVNLIVGVRTGRTAAHPAVDPTAETTAHPAHPARTQDGGGAPASPAQAPTPLHDIVPAIRVERLAGGRLQELSFALAPGEIVGLAGLIGSGAEDVPYLLFGALAASAGTLTMGDQTCSIPQMTPSEAVRMRIALIPADRKQLGLGLRLAVWENMVMLIQDDHFRGGRFRRDELVGIANQGVDDFGIKPPRADIRTDALSGGNQQKLLLAKWLLARPKMMIAHEPTQGVDVGARQDIYGLVRRAAEREGMAVVWVTTDFAELEEVCDRVVIVSRGRRSGELRDADVNEESISAAVLRQLEEVG